MVRWSWFGDEDVAAEAVAIMFEPKRREERSSAGWRKQLRLTASAVSVAPSGGATRKLTKTASRRVGFAFDVTNHKKLAHSTLNLTFP